MKLSEAIYGFNLHILSANYSPVTAKNYQIFLNLFAKHLGNPEIDNITTENINGFFQSLRQSAHTESTLHAYWKAIRSFYNWAEKELSIERPDTLPAPHYINRAILPFTRAEIASLLKAVKTKRNTALLLILLDTGARVSEVARMTLADLDLDAGSIQIRAWHNGAKSRPRLVRLGHFARRAIWAYTASRTDPAGPNAPLFATSDGKHLDRFGISKILKRIANNAGIKDCHPHRFRHTFAIEYLRNGGDIFTLQELLGHNSLSMVRRYLTLAQSDLAAAHRRASPVDNWRL